MTPKFDIPERYQDASDYGGFSAQAGYKEPSPLKGGPELVGPSAEVKVAHALENLPFCKDCDSVVGHCLQCEIQRQALAKRFGLGTMEEADKIIDKCRDWVEDDRQRWSEVA